MMKYLLVLIGLILVLGISAYLLVFGGLKKNQGQNIINSVQNQPLSTGVISGTNTPTPANTRITGIQSGGSLGLIINQPRNGQTFTSAMITVKGQTSPNSEVSVNEQDVKADSRGNFSANITLDEGENIINVVSGDENGNWNEIELTVSYQSQ